MKISEYYDLPDFDPNNLSEAKIKHYIDIIKQKHITYWQPTIHHSKKLQFYSLFKHVYKISSYLDLNRNSANRKDLVKIRISNHKLMIETGRLIKLPATIDSALFVTLVYFVTLV